MFKIKVDNESENFARLAVEPLEAGFGHTLGNSLRRVMLTSLSGCAITSIKIDGIAHQFSTIEGIAEDVIEIILNIKKIKIKVFSDKPIKLTLKASGKKSVKASDIAITGDGEIVNGEQHIASMTDAKAKLNLEMTAEKGKGYQMAGDNQNKEEIGVIAVDALFSPVTAVNYTVEPTRVGRSADFDKLVLDVSTNGVITPADALNEAAKILSETFRKIYEPDAEEEIHETGANVISEEVLKMTVEELDLPVRITNALKAIDVLLMEDLINIPRPQLLKAKNLGAKSLALISEKLLERGLSLREA